MKSFRSLLLLSLSVSLFAGMSFGEQIKTGSDIIEATVYPDAAMISRRAVQELLPGEYSIVFPDVIPQIEEHSLRASVSPTDKVVLSGARFRRRYLEEDPSPRVHELRSRIRELEDDTRKLRDLRSALEEKKQFIDSVRLSSQRRMPEELAGRVPEADELEGLLGFIERNTREYYAQVMEVDLELRAVSDKLEVLRAELRQISSPTRKMVREIVVDLEVLERGNFEIDLTYLARGASWHPTYDARVDLEQGEVKFCSYGVIKQNTGEDWEDVRLTLSTARATVEGRMPEVRPWFIGEGAPRRQVSPGTAGHALRKAQVETAEARSLREAIVEERGVAVTYELVRPVTVRSDGSEHKFPISAQALPVDLEYSAYPRAAPEAYLRSGVTNDTSLQFLPGRVNIFLDGAFVGSSRIGNISPGEEFDLYLGMDRNVEVRRELIERKTDRTWFGRIPAANVKETRIYKLTAQNYKTGAIRVALFDAMPVSRDDRIKIRVEDVSLEPEDKDWEDRKGVWRWGLSLKPREKVEIFYTLTIEYPRDMQVRGL